MSHGSEAASSRPETAHSSWQSDLARDGFVVFRQVYAEDEMQQTARRLTDSLHRAAAAHDDAGDSSVTSAIRSRGGVIYAARNLLDVFPPSRAFWDRPRLREALVTSLGEQCGLVRGLYFDKPPDQSWSLPWHQDRTIAVADNRLPTDYFRNPTEKEGVAHVEAPFELLQNMLTLRIHLDLVSSENGPLLVMPGSHETEVANVANVANSAAATPILAAAGDVLLMRPLLSHCSGKSADGCRLHRRILHLEFAAHRELPDGFAWHHFLPLGTA